MYVYVCIMHVCVCTYVFIYVCVDAHLWRASWDYWQWTITILWPHLKIYSIWGKLVSEWQRVSVHWWTYFTLTYGAGVLLPTLSIYSLSPVLICTVCPAQTTFKSFYLSVSTERKIIKKTFFHKIHCSITSFLSFWNDFDKVSLHPSFPNSTKAQLLHYIFMLSCLSES